MRRSNLRAAHSSIRFCRLGVISAIRMSTSKSSFEGVSLKTIHITQNDLSYHLMTIAMSNMKSNGIIIACEL